MKSPSMRRKILKDDWEGNDEESGVWLKQGALGCRVSARGIPQALLGGPSLLNESCQGGASSDKQHTS